MTDSAFWRYSLKFYAVPGVAEACVELQDTCGADVNILLFLLFLAERRLHLGRGALDELDRAIAGWRDGTVKPLRAQRRRLKDGIPPVAAANGEPLRSLVKRAELESERLEQEWLESQIPVLSLSMESSRDKAAVLNLAAYTGYLGTIAGEPLKIVLRAFTELPP